METPQVDIEALERAHDGTVALIDVREPDEYHQFHVAGAALIPLATVPDALDQIPADRPVYVICRSGGRSLKAAEFLRRQGRDAINVAGGTQAWVAAGKPYATGPDPD